MASGFTYRTNQAIKSGDLYNQSINNFKTGITSPQPTVASVTGPVVTNENPLLTVVTVSNGTFVTPQSTLIVHDPKFGGQFTFVVGQ